MLRHQGTKRKEAHNVQLASLPGLAAGFVNAAGFLGFVVLTTNETGHAVLFAEKIAFGDLGEFLNLIALRKPCWNVISDN